jgi:hypothetical protein
MFAVTLPQIQGVSASEGSDMSTVVHCKETDEGKGQELKIDRVWDLRIDNLYKEDVEKVAVENLLSRIIALIHRYWRR